MKVVSIVGHSGVGKTTLIEALVPEFRRRGLRVALVKHSSHAHGGRSAEKPGSDSSRFERLGPVWSAFVHAGGAALRISSALGDAELRSLLESLSAPVDLLLVEGWKHGPFPKVEVWRSEAAPARLGLAEVGVVLSNDQEPVDAGALEWLRLDDVVAAADAVFRVASSRDEVKAAASPREETTDRAPLDPPLERRMLRVSEVRRVSPHGDDTANDLVAVEEPLEIRIAGETLAITMRTPGHDFELAAGFLFAEGILRDRRELGNIQHCGRIDAEGFENTVDVTAAPGVLLDVDKAAHTRRGTLTTSACGVCGRQSVDDLLAACGVLVDARRFDPLLPVIAQEQLAANQPVFERTGGVHAAVILSASGEVLASAEDVGRHNAVDKVVGRLFLEERLTGSSEANANRPAILAVSGRASFEILQKAAMAKIPVVASVSAPSSLAVSVAQQVGITLAGFVRGDRYNLYSHPERLESP